MDFSEEERIYAQPLNIEVFLEELSRLDLLFNGNIFPFNLPECCYHDPGNDEEGVHQAKCREDLPTRHKLCVHRNVSTSLHMS